MSADNITFRKWEADDCAVVAEIEKLCFSDPWSEEMVESSFSEEHFLGVVAESGGKIAAYVGLSVVFDTADVLLIAVLEDYRKRGIATELLKRSLIAAAKLGAKRAMLEVDEKNLPAILCYSKFGFKKIAERKNYYGDGKNAYIMEKTLLNNL